MNYTTDPRADGCSPAETPLERVNYLANRAESAGDAIDAFICRFRGLPQGDCKSTLAGIPAGHEGQISRLDDQIGRLESLVAQLSTIG